MHRTILASLIVAALAAPPARAELNLPERTIVVRDFARRRQDLLDTLRVNLPDMEVEIQEFRGADVVLEVTVSAEVEDQAQAERTLRRHCQRLIRRAFQGMRLASSSRFVFEDTQEDDEVSQGDLVARLKNALAKMRGEDEAEDGEEASEAEDAAPGAPEDEEARESLAAAGAPTPKESKERQGYLASLQLAAEKRYRKLLARAKGETSEPSVPLLAASTGPKPRPVGKAAPEGPPPVALVAPSRTLSPETTERMARYPAVPAPKGAASREQLQRGLKARRAALLARQAKRRALVDRITSAQNVSPETRKAIQAFERGRSSTATVQGIYAQIFQDRTRTTPREDAPVALGSPRIEAPPSAPPRLAAAPDLAARAARAAAAAPASTSDQSADALLGSKIEALFDSVEAWERGRRP